MKYKEKIGIEPDIEVNNNSEENLKAADDSGSEAEKAADDSGSNTKKEPGREEREVPETEDTQHDVSSISHSWFYRKFAAPVLHINDEPKAVAGGVAMGIIIAMTPTVGIQMILVLIIHTIIRVNRLAGIIMVYISNPFTLIPIYWLDYVVGSIALNRKFISYSHFRMKMDVIFSQLKAVHLWDMFTEFLSLIGELALPLFVGGIIVGLVCGIPMYPITLRAVKRHRERKEARKKRKLEKKRHKQETGSDA